MNSLPPDLHLGFVAPFLQPTPRLAISHPLTLQIVKPFVCSSLSQQVRSLFVTD